METFKVKTYLLSGQHLADLEVTPSTRIRQLKSLLRKYIPQKDEVERMKTNVGLVFQKNRLDNNDMTVNKAGLFQYADVQVVFEIKEVTCCTQREAGCDVEDLRVVRIPEFVKNIEKGAFRGCSNLVSVTIPNSVAEIWDDAFEGCISLTGITIPNSVTCIEDCAFKGCRNLLNVTIGNSVVSIADGAFYGCESLSNLRMSNSVVYIGRRAFSEISSSVRIEDFPERAKVEEDAFDSDLECSPLLGRMYRPTPGHYVSPYADPYASHAGPYASYAGPYASYAGPYASGPPGGMLTSGGSLSALEVCRVAFQTPMRWAGSFLSRHLGFLTQANTWPPPQRPQLPGAKQKTQINMSSPPPLPPHRRQEEEVPDSGAKIKRKKGRHRRKKDRRQKKG